MALISLLENNRDMVLRKPRPVPKPPRPRNYIKAWRKFRVLTQARLAERADMSVGSISQIESGKQGVTDETLGALAMALDCDPGDLLSRDPTAPDYQSWCIITGLKPDKQRQALKILKALADEDGEAA